MRLPSDFCPAGAPAAGGRVFQCRTQYIAASRTPKTGIHDQSKQQFGTAFAHKKAAVRGIHEIPHIFFSFGNHANQFVRSGVVAPLIVGNGSIVVRTTHN